MRYYDFLELPFLKRSRSHTKAFKFALLCLSPTLPPSLILNSHTRFVTPTWSQWETEIQSCCHFVRLISLSLSGPDSLWQYGGTHTQSHTQTHILWVLVTCSQKMPLSTSRETDRGGSGGTAAGGVKEREDVECWLVTFLKSLASYFSAVSEGERQRDNNWKGEGLISLVVKC